MCFFMHMSLRYKNEDVCTCVDFLAVMMFDLFLFKRLCTCLFFDAGGGTEHEAVALFFAGCRSQTGAA